MAVPPFIISSVALVAQEAGLPSARGPACPAPNTAVSLAADVYGADIALPADDGAGGVDVYYGDVVGTDVIDVTPWTFTVANHTGRTRDSGPASLWDTPHPMLVTGGFRDAVDAQGYVLIPASSGTGEVCVFRFNGKGASPPSLLNVQHVAGTGFIDYDSLMYDGDPRTGFRGSLKAKQTNPDIRNGYTIDSWLTDPHPPTPLQQGVAYEVFPFPGGDRYGSGRTLQTIGSVFPRQGSPSVALGDTIAITNITNTGGSNTFTTFTTSSAHGLEMGRPTPSGPAVFIGGYTGGIPNIDSHDFVIYDAPTPTTFRVKTFSSSAGTFSAGPFGCFAFFPYNIYTGASAPSTVPRDGNVVWGACSIPMPSGGRRKIATTQATLWHGTSVVPNGCHDIWISDDDWATPVNVATLPNNVRFDSPVQGITPYFDAADHAGYGAPHVISISGPGNILTRWSLANLQKPTPVITDIQYLNLVSNAWQSTIPSSATSKLFSDAPSNAISLRWNSHFACWIATYTQEFSVFARFSYDLINWSVTRLIATYGTYGINAGLIYNGWQHPLSGVAPQDPDAIYVGVSLFGAYNTYLLKAVISDPGVRNFVPTQQYNRNQVMPGGGDANWDSWIWDLNAWTRTGPYTYVIGVDARSYLKPGTSVLWSTGFGVIGSISFAAGSSTVNLITNTDYTLPAGVLTDVRYSPVASPPGRPTAFNWSPTITGYSVLPSNASYQWAPIEAGLIELFLREGTVGTKDATATSPTYTLPIQAMTLSNAAWQGSSTIRNNTTQPNACSLIVVSGGSTLKASSSYASADVWSPSTPAQIQIGSVRYRYA